jgi:hypothetical protein
MKEEKVTSLTTYPGYHLLVRAALDKENDYRDYLDLPFTYSVADTSIAKVDKFGQVTGLVEGTTTLTAKAANGKSTKCKLTVTKKPEDIVKDEMVALGMANPVGYGGYRSSEYFMDSDYSAVDETQLIALPNNELGIFNRIELENGSQKLEATIYNKEYKVVDTRAVALPYTSWGGIILGEDGCYYVAVGQSNIEESDTKVVFAIIKYDLDFKELDRCDISDCYSSIPFYASNCSMAMKDSTLVVYTARGRYKDEGGVTHQSNIALVIDTNTMKQYDTFVSTFSHVSHSFNQLVKYDKDNLIYVDHGDGDPRAVVLNSYIDFNTMITKDYVEVIGGNINLLNIEGNSGDNDTGTRVGGLEIGTYHNLVAGVSIPHGSLKGGVRDYETKNIFVALASKDGSSSELKWLTNYKEGGASGVLNLRMVKINDNKFALIYFKYNNENKYTGLILIDSNGKVLKNKEWKGTFDGTVQPIIYEHDIIWIERKAGYIKNNDYPELEYRNNFIRVDVSGVN